MTIFSKVTPLQFGELATRSALTSKLQTVLPNDTRIFVGYHIKMTNRIMQEIGGPIQQKCQTGVNKSHFIHSSGMVTPHDYDL